MLGIGHRLEKETKKKILVERAREYNQRYDELVAQGKEPEAAKIIAEEQYQKRHPYQPDLEPYNNSWKMNELEGTTHLGYNEHHKTLSETKTMYKPMEEKMARSKQTKPDLQKTMEAKEEFHRMKKRICKDHLQEDAEIDLGEPKQTDYTRNFVNDEKLQQQTKNRDKKHNQKMNDLKDYAQNYLKSKNSLRKC